MGVGDLIVIGSTAAGSACQVTKVERNPHKHVHQLKFEAKDIFSGAETFRIFPSRGMIQRPVVKKSEWVLVDIKSGWNFVTGDRQEQLVLTNYDDQGTERDDILLPKDGQLAGKIRATAPNYGCT